MLRVQKSSFMKRYFFDSCNSIIQSNIFWNYSVFRGYIYYSYVYSILQILLLRRQTLILN